jgi:probable DNA metabolism protein
MPAVFVHDGTFQGLLTVIQRLRESGEEPEDIRGDDATLQESLLAETVHVTSDAARVERACSDICSRISPRALRHTLNAFLSEMEGADYHIYRYLQLGWRMGDALDARLGDEHVHVVHRMSRCTGREAHRMRGFLRFRRLENGLYYAPMHSECDVLCLVAPYFLGRMGDQDWMIHDLAREQAALCRRGELELSTLPEFDPHLTEEEGFYQELWRDYFKTIAIAERKNRRLQMSCMPKKYWNILIEKPQQKPQ